MSEEIKQKAVDFLNKQMDENALPVPHESVDEWATEIMTIHSQALEKRDSQIIKMLENTDVQMSVSGDVGQDEIAMAKFIYKAHIKHIIKKIESAIIPPNSINGTLPSETDSATK